MLYVGRYLMLVGLFYLIENVIGAICYKKRKYYSYYYVMYCGNGCCGSLYDRYCCVSVGVIVGACISALIVLIIIIVVVVIICKKKKQATVGITMHQPSTQVTSVQYGPPQPMGYGYAQPVGYPGQPVAYGAQPATGPSMGINPAYPPPPAKY